jgi:hypothetical protein
VEEGVEFVRDRDFGKNRGCDVAAGHVGRSGGDRGCEAKEATGGLELVWEGEVVGKDVVGRVEVDEDLGNRC